MEEQKIKLAQEAIENFEIMGKSPGKGLFWSIISVTPEAAEAIVEYVRHLESIIQIQNKLSNEQC